MAHSFQASLILAEPIVSLLETALQAAAGAVAILEADESSIRELEIAWK
ncbi:MAG: hypothetical protein HRT89_04225 [Lentisphaeria bacterium]|nr:hypothetical protein [Lentisphaeria bacterium]NQZ67257.1 hypothetical protein [Lentisphaeria bacterium]